MTNKCRHSDLQPWYVTQAWQLLERIHHNRDTWEFELGGEGGIVVEYDYLNAYKKQVKQKKLLMSSILMTILFCEFFSLFQRTLKHQRKNGFNALHHLNQLKSYKQ
jgi:hypothetical protein